LVFHFLMFHSHYSNKGITIMTFKKSLVLTTALTAVGALAATSAMAAGKPKLKVSGYQETYASLNLDRTAGQTGTGTPSYAGAQSGGFNLVQYGEIRFKVKGKADNGMKWGVRFESVMNDASDDGKKIGGDEANMYLSGSWGKLEIGGQDGAADRVKYHSNKDFSVASNMVALVADTRGTRIRGAEDLGSINDSSDDTKLTYWSPRVSGFQGAYSYAPNAGSRGSNGLSTAGSFHEGSVSYKGRVAGGKVRLALRGTQEDGAAPDGDNIEAWSISGRYEANNVRISGGYTGGGERRAGTANDTLSSWDIGVRFSQGPWAVGVGYYDAEHEVNGADDDEYSQITIHGAYSLGRGLTLSAALFSFDNDDSTVANATDGEAPSSSYWPSSRLA